MWQLFCRGDKPTASYPTGERYVSRAQLTESCSCHAGR